MRCSLLSALVSLIASVAVAAAAVAQAPLAPNGRFVRTSTGRVYLEDSGSGTPMILLHGFGGTVRFWDPYVPTWASGHRVIAVDLPGHGRSDALDTTIVFRHEGAAITVLALMDSLRLHQALLVGFSSGGITALYAASLAPSRVQALVVVGAQVYYSREVRDWIEQQGPDSTKAEQMARLAEQHGPARGMQLARQFWHFRQLLGDPALTPDRLASITARTLIIHGDDDFVPVSQAWEMYRSIPGAHLWIVPHAGHWPFRDAQPRDDFARRLVTFADTGWRH